MSMRTLLVGGVGKDSFTTEQENTIEILNYVTGTLSIIGSTFIMVCVLYFKKWNNFHFRLVFMLSLSDLMYSAVGYMGNAAV